jgi:penicillin-binding protein 1A
MSPPPPPTPTTDHWTRARQLAQRARAAALDGLRWTLALLIAWGRDLRAAARATHRTVTPVVVRGLRRADATLARGARRARVGIVAVASAVARRDAGLRSHRAWRLARWPLMGATVALALAVGITAWLYATVDLPEDPPQQASTIVYDTAGNELALLQRDGFRIDVALDDVAPVAIDALLAAEDQRFYEHGGLDPSGLLRAVANNVRGGDTQGASTITQQLVKNSYLSSERTITRKVREAVLAFKLERREDKDEILERYLNTVYFGRGALGIEAAARMYFGTGADQLEAHQAALLVSMLRAPGSADPTTDPPAAERRRALVIDAMVHAGSLHPEEAKAAHAQPLGATDTLQPPTLLAGTAPHFVEWVREDLVEELGEDEVYGGGLRVHTTLDPADQAAAEMVVASHLTHPDEPQAALVAMDRSGAVRAHVGGRDFDALQVDLARGRDGGGTGRQAGSTFKPFVLAAALERGIPLGTRYPAPAEMSFDLPVEPWEVSNYGSQGFGDQSLLDATARSVNTVYAQLVLEVGADAVADLARRAGIRDELAPLPSLALGTGEVSVLDMASAYLTLARDGEWVAPRIIERIETADGRVLFEAEGAATRRAMEVGPARAVTHALEGVLTDGTGTEARLDRPAAGKTGTTQSNGDAWFAGYTPEYAAVVWMGYPEGPQRQMDSVQGASVTGGGLPARIWQAFMAAALTDVAPTGFEPPPPELLATPAPPPTTQAPRVDDAPQPSITGGGGGGGGGGGPERSDRPGRGRGRDR